MPNWTSNSIRIEGAEADIRAFLDVVKSQDQLFDFNRIIPMPELLMHTGSGCGFLAQQNSYGAAGALWTAPPQSRA